MREGLGGCKDHRDADQPENEQRNSAGSDESFCLFWGQTADSVDERDDHIWQHRHLQEIDVGLTYEKNFTAQVTEENAEKCAGSKSQEYLCGQVHQSLRIYEIN